MSLLVWVIPQALAANPITFGCPNPPCALTILSMDHNIAPPDQLKVAEAQIAPTRLEWLEITLTTTRGEVEVTVDGIFLDPRAGIEDLRLGTTRWVVPAGDITDGVAVDVFNPSSRLDAAYELVAKVVVEH